ncbi:uncharacterized protein LOC109720448 [Ananas comosus]|uniref:Uncharacterized protein LOC109720448 n=1 Tax=Ananas comosus TaxID=4615 RepID=A0A6P5GBB0_ANACO|nr:uncharacterized protein LOC109720448 [Ananas comosus]
MRIVIARGLAWRSLGSSRPYRLHGDRQGSRMAEFGIFWAVSFPWRPPGIWHGGVWDLLGLMVSMATARVTSFVTRISTYDSSSLLFDRFYLVIVHESLLFVIGDEFHEVSRMAEFGIF